MLTPIKTTDFEAIRLRLASPEDILSWSHGEVTKPETINYRTQRPERDGLFCEKIFGPTKDWRCYCGKYKKIRYKGIVCDKCGVEVTRSIVRRERMGHITLEAPCSHIWFLRGLSSKLGKILNIGMNSLEKVIYFANFIIINVDNDLREDVIEQIKDELNNKKNAIANEFKNKIKQIKVNKKELLNSGEKEKKVEKEIQKEIQKVSEEKEDKIKNIVDVFNSTLKELKDLKPLSIISEELYQSLSLKYGHIFEAGIGAGAIREILSKIDLDKTIKQTKIELENITDVKKKQKIMEKLRIFNGLKKNNIKPEWMIMTHIPIIPPDLRPMVALDGDRYAASDLNDLYRRVINRNNRLKQLKELNAPEVIARNEKRMLQEAVDALIDNSSRQSKTVIASTGQKRQLKSLADSLKGKQGRFRQNLLGKRTDYSGRSVIVVNPKLRLDQCGLPKIMAIELFRPFVISKLIKNEIVHNVKSASRFIDSGVDVVWDMLEEVVNDAFVLLNRAPTLHRLGIQAFRPILIEGKAIQIHPLVCSAFNADFDGDQMAVHVPLTEEAKDEARDIMLSSKNLLKPATGDPVIAPSQDIVLGIYYVTQANEIKDKKNIKVFSSPVEAKIALENNYIKLQDVIKVKIDGLGIIETTVGRIIFNEVLPEKLRFVNNIVKKGDLKALVEKCIYLYKQEDAVKFIDNLKNKAFEIVTKSGLSFGMGDLSYFEEKDKLIANADDQIKEVEEQYEDGLLTSSEKSSKIIETWSSVKERITDICKAGLDKTGTVHLMIDSGARGSWDQLTQILGMKGLVISPSGDIIELPVKGNFKKGFGVLEYFISTHGVRKGLSDTALRTANAGYLTRRLVDVSQDVIVEEDDCGDRIGIIITKQESEEIGEDILKRITGRYLAQDLKNKEGKVLVKAGELLSFEVVKNLEGEEIEEVCIRSVLSCNLSKGVCAKCYGLDLGNNKPVKLGTPVGIIAAQSIGEPGTQLTMRTFHTGGVVGASDITQGLPRVEEVFEAKTPKKKAILAEEEGIIYIESEKRKIKDSKGKEIIVEDSRRKILRIEYIGYDSTKYYFSDLINKVNLKKETKNKPKILVKTGDEIEEGQELFLLDGKSVKAKESGIIEVAKNYVKVISKSKKIDEMVTSKGTEILVNDKDKVKKGQPLTEGSLDLQQLFKLTDKKTVQSYILKEIQYVYSSQGQPLNDKHVEVISRQMFSRCMITDSGNTDLLYGDIIEKSVFERANQNVKKKAKSIDLLFGITKASLTTDSFLSSASFQETARVLVDASINGKIDYLEGLKENVIIGRLIPAGTGYKKRKKRKVYSKIG